MCCGAEQYASPRYQERMGGAYILVPLCNETRDENGNIIYTQEPVRDTNGNLVLAVAHCDEGGIHLHADILLITEDNRLSSKTLITRDFITSIHDKLPLVLQHHGFDVERGTSGKVAGLNAKEYKKKIHT